MVFQKGFEVATRGRGSYLITEEIQRYVAAAGVAAGVAHLFLHHTSASLLLCENADPAVRADLERFMARLVPDGDPLFEHSDEGPDDMPAHVRTLLAGSALSIPVTAGRCALGTWQGIYLWEHRHAGHRRRLTLTVLGE
ncbi:MAG: secondary thiamine-phosphate synthase enzyme YjbQ [Gammaproteobacteria bacterium]|nr:secondary thiamine-phosphate synthase enzyme YjbQ [Gammaproteobacteria bacterium]